MMPAKPIPESYWVEPGSFLAGEYPSRMDPLVRKQRLTALLRAGFDTYIDLTRPGEREPYAPALLEEAGFYGLQATCQRFPIGDQGLPTYPQMCAILGTIHCALERRRKVYLHCWAGVGRTGTTVGCYFVQNGMTGEQALARLAELFQTARQSMYFPTSPETLDQVKFIQSWKPVALPICDSTPESQPG